MKKSIMIGFLLSLVFLGFSLAEEPSIKIGLSGFGVNGETYITIHNTGNISVTEINITIDGNYYKTIKGKSAPRKGFELPLYLQKGRHTIEAQSAEGAYDSLSVDVPELKVGTPKQQLETFSFLEKYRTFIILGVIISPIPFKFLL